MDSLLVSDAGRQGFRLGDKMTYTLVQGCTRTNKETRPNRATDGNHLNMAGLHGPFKLRNAIPVLASLERLEGDAGAGPLADGLARSTLARGGGRGFGLFIIRQLCDGVAAGVFHLHDGGFVHYCEGYFGCGGKRS